MDINHSLKEIGLTNSEAKVYLALLKVGLSSKSRIITHARIASSKIYEVLDKLMDKGLVSMIIKNNVRNYEAAPVERIKDFIREKKEKLQKEEEIISNIIPLLTNLKEEGHQTTAEIFRGWKGIENVYSTLIDRMRTGEEAYILGASKGTDSERTKNFFLKYARITQAKKISTKIIFNEDSRSYINEMERELKIRFNKRFLQKNTCVEIAIANENIGIIILKEDPIVILIKDKETAESFVVYFKELWNVSKD
jgi:sugar-specific transcriptional regulator TrmB